jgi:hypothetical protein
MTPEFEKLLQNLPAGLFVPHRGPLPTSEMDHVPDVAVGVLPDSYRAFVSIVGPGSWTNDSGVVMSPSEVYAFDADCWEAEGYIALVENAAGVGDYVAVNPADPSVNGERPVYYCGHDPFSCVRAADSFEAWVRDSAQSSLSSWRRYEYLDVARDDSYRRYRESMKARRKPGPWWQFWR